MKIMKKISVLILITLLGGCAVNKTWDEKGGDKKKGTVFYTSEYERGQPPKDDDLTLYWLSRTKCEDWGYDGAEYLGEKETKCLKRDAEDSCTLYRQISTWNCKEADD